MRLRTKLLFAFLASPAFLFVQSLRASQALRSLGRDVDSLDSYNQSEDLRSQIMLELLSLPDPQTVASDPGRVRDVVHAERALVLCRSLERSTRGPGAKAAVASSEAALIELVSAMRLLAVEAKAHGVGAILTPAGTRAHDAWTGIERVRGRTEPLGMPRQDAFEPVAQEARGAMLELARRSKENASTFVATGLGLAILLTVVAAVGLARVTAQPVLRLLKAARAVSRGQLETSVPVRSRDELGELSAAFNDMTRRLRDVYQGLEDTVRVRTDELRRREWDLARERKLAAVGRLAAGVAHEVSNPLAVIAASAEGLRDRAREDPELARYAGFQDFPAYLEHIEREAYRLKRLVRRLLDFSRGGSTDDAAPEEREPFDLVSVVRDAVALASLDPRAKARPIDARSLDGMAPLPLTGHPEALKEALLNLIFNALDATEENAGSIAVSVRREREGPVENAIVLVRDTGKGLERKDLDRLFEPFFTTKPPGQGTGLGLALAYRACERHGGRLVAASEGPAKGASFSVVLPIAS